MGAPGAMMSPMTHGAAGSSNDDKRSTATAVDGAAVLATAAEAFRGPARVPTISGGGGNDFATAKGDAEHHRQDTSSTRNPLA